ncbi:MAG: hypothetical protein AAFV53_29625 [Myxococcota bacterium]
MKDLREQLAARFGAPAKEPDAPASSTKDDPLGPSAHLQTDWLARLRVLGPSVGIPVKAAPSLNAAKQLTDKTLKALKKAGKKHDKRDLEKLRGEYLKKREKLAWSAIKEQFTALNLSQKTYRALKQDKKADPEKILGRLKKLDAQQAAEMGAARLRDALLG